MSILFLVEAMATLLWVFAGLSVLAWANHLRRSPQGAHIAHVTDMIANLVPVMIVLLLVVIAGAMIGLPSIVVLIAVLFPGGLAIAFHMSLRAIRDAPAPRADLLRLLGALVLAIALVLWRQAL